MAEATTSVTRQNEQRLTRRTIDDLGQIDLLGLALATLQLRRISKAQT